MQINTFPDEFLIRWRHGMLVGYHVVPVQLACDDTGAPLLKENGEDVMRVVGQATTLERAGLNLDGILGSALSAALKANDALATEKVALEAEKVALATSLENATRIAQTRAATIASLQSELAALRLSLQSV